MSICAHVTPYCP